MWFICFSTGVVSLLIAGLYGFLEAAEPSPQIEQAGKYFQEAQLLWKQDAGRLWGLSLEGPMLFADRQHIASWPIRRTRKAGCERKETCSSVNCRRTST